MSEKNFGSTDSISLKMDALNNQIASMQRYIEAANLVNEQITIISTANNFPAAINNMLGNIGRFVGAERVYIFEKINNYYPNTYEWCDEGIRSEMPTLQRVTEQDIDVWLEELEKQHVINITDINQIEFSQPRIYAFLKRQRIKNVIEAPIILNNELIGFLGVDNAPENMRTVIIDSLRTLASYLAIIRHSRKKLSQTLEWGQLQEDTASALSQDYEIVTHIDLTYQRALVQRCSEKFFDIFEKDDKKVYRHRDILTEFVNKYVRSEDQDEVLRFANCDYLKQVLLEKKDGIFFNFMSQASSDNGGHHYEMRFVNLSRKKENNQVVCGIRNVDGAMIREAQYRNKLKELMDEANLANQAKTDFFSHMSHDIRTPLNSIIGMSYVAGKHLSDPQRVKDCLSKISDSSSYLLSLINTVLDMNRIERGVNKLSHDEINFSEFLDNLLIILKPQFQVRKHHFEIRTINLFHETFYSDNLRIKQIFLNLLTNAIKYTPDGGQLSLSIEEKLSKDPNKSTFEFIFEDNGIGMSSIFLSRIFEPFERANDEWSNNVSGIGLGMTIVKRIVNLMGGTIVAESQLDVGTKFTVTLTLDVKTHSENSLSGYGVLILNNNEQALNNASAVLKTLSAECVGCVDIKNLKENINRYVQENSKKWVILTDKKMLDFLSENQDDLAIFNDALIPKVILIYDDYNEPDDDLINIKVSQYIHHPLLKTNLYKAITQAIGEDNNQDHPCEDLREVHYINKRILLVEDNKLNREIATEILNMLGIEVETATNGKQALERIQFVPEGYYDLVFMDIQMPIMNGLDATIAIRQLKTNYSIHVPIIAMTANVLSEDVQATLLAGMNEHISKPLDMRKLREILDRWLV